MDNQYYIPEIEEFHIGFQYEELSGVDSEMEDWMEKTFEDPSDFEEIAKLIKAKCLRVKYLDKEDIESFGFTQLEDIINIFKYKKHYSTNGLLDSKYWKYWHITLLERSEKYPNVIIHNNEDYDEGETLFEGWIKNKSELKVLLKQLNIL